MQRNYSEVEKLLIKAVLQNIKERELTVAEKNIFNTQLSSPDILSFFLVQAAAYQRSELMNYLINEKKVDTAILRNWIAGNNLQNPVVSVLGHTVTDFAAVLRSAVERDNVDFLTELAFISEECRQVIIAKLKTLPLEMLARAEGIQDAFPGIYEELVRLEREKTKLSDIAVAIRGNDLAFIREMSDQNISTEAKEYFVAYAVTCRHVAMLKVLLDVKRWPASGIQKTFSIDALPENLRLLDVRRGITTIREAVASQNHEFLIYLSKYLTKDILQSFNQYGDQNVKHILPYYIDYQSCLDKMKRRVGISTDELNSVVALMQSPIHKRYIEEELFQTVLKSDHFGLFASCFMPEEQSLTQQVKEKYLLEAAKADAGDIFKGLFSAFGSDLTLKFCHQLKALGDDQHPNLKRAIESLGGIVSQQVGQMFLMFQPAVARPAASAAPRFDQ